MCEAGSKKTWNKVVINDFAQTSAGVNFAMVRMIPDVGKLQIFRTLPAKKSP